MDKKLVAELGNILSEDFNMVLEPERLNKLATDLVAFFSILTKNDEVQILDKKNEKVQS